MSERPAGDAEVLVVGAGPVGLTAAHELLRRGVRVRIVDRASGPAVTSRALATHARTMEVYHQMGVVDALLPRGQRVEHFSLHQNGRRLIRFDTNYSALPTHYPHSLMVDQIVTEEVLREAVARQGGRIEWGVELLDLTGLDDRVEARLRNADGTDETFTVPWLVGTDGGRSTVRKKLGLRLLGESTEVWLNADVVLDADLPRDSNHLVRSGAGALLLVPFPEPGKWRVVDTEDVGNADDAEAVRARLAGKLSRALRRPVTVSTPTWVSAFTVQQRMIERMRVGRCFVAGDAAHVHSPASGQGMNTGIQDAYNLAWKLADVVRGYADDELLDSYGAERVPIGRALLGSTRKAAALVALRNAAAPVALPVGLGFLSLAQPLKRRIEGKIMRGFCGLSLHYGDSPLTQRNGSEPNAGLRPGLRVNCSAETAREHPGWAALREELTDPRWVLLAFPVEDGPNDGLAMLLKHLDRGYGAAVSIRTVTRSGDSSAGPAPLADPDDALRRSLGGTGWTLIRPDGYLAGSGRLGGLRQIRSMESVLGSFHLRQTG